MTDHEVMTEPDPVTDPTKPWNAPLPSFRAPLPDEPVEAYIKVRVAALLLAEADHITAWYRSWDNEPADTKRRFAGELFFISLRSGRLEQREQKLRRELRGRAKAAA